MNESDWTSKLCTVLTRYGGAMCEGIVGSRMNRKGRPDRYISSIWWHGWLESKMRDAPLSPYQKQWHKEARQRQPNSVYIIRFWPPNTFQLCLWDYVNNTEKVLFTSSHLQLITSCRLAEQNKEYVHGILKFFAEPK